MGLNPDYGAVEPARDAVDRLPGPTLLEFGSAGCGHCRAAQPLLAQAFEGHARVRHIKVADASGRRLGRSYGVKLWPTLVFLHDGREVARAVRPADSQEVRAALAQIDPPAPENS